MTLNIIFFFAYFSLPLACSSSVAFSFSFSSFRLLLFFFIFAGCLLFSLLRFSLDPNQYALPYEPTRTIDQEPEQVEGVQVGEKPSRCRPSRPSRYYFILNRFVLFQTEIWRRCFMLCALRRTKPKTRKREEQ